MYVYKYTEILYKLFKEFKNNNKIKIIILCNHILILLTIDLWSRQCTCMNTLMITY